MRRFRTAAALALAGLASIAGGIAVGRPEIEFLGASFARESGKPAYSFVGEQHGPGLFSIHDGNLWIGAGLACCLAAVVVAALAVSARRAGAD